MTPKLPSVVAASKAGFKVRAMDVTGAYWNDVGDPATYARGVLDALRESGETVYLSPGARCGSRCTRSFPRNWMRTSHSMQC